MMNILEAIVAVVLIILVMIVVFGGLMYYNLHGEMNPIPRLHIRQLTANKVRKRQAKVLNKMVKDWNDLIIEAVDRGESGAYIDYYSKSYSKISLEYAVKYFRGKGFDVDYTPSSAYISWNKENE